jgi:hypothetical protein
MSVSVEASSAQKRLADQALENVDRLADEVRSSGRISAIRLDSFDVIEPHLLEPWLIIGMGTTLFSGDNGIGKSATALWTAARVTLGICAGELHEPANVLLLLSEDAPGIIRPKLEALNADMSRVYVVVCTQPDEAATEGTTYLQLPRQGRDLEALIASHHIRLVILDALADCFEHPDINKTENVAPVLTFLNHLSSKYDMAVIGIHHTNKNLLDGAKNAVRGSKAFTDKARQVVSFIKTEDAYGFQVTKSNFMEGSPAWRYTLESAPTLTPGKTTGIISTPVPDDGLDVDSEMRKSANLDEDRQSTSGDVIDWLTDYLREGPAPFKQIADAARDEGYTSKQLSNARTRADNPRVESVPDPSWSGRGQRKIWRLAASSITSHTGLDGDVRSNENKSGTVAAVGETITSQLLLTGDEDTGENKSGTQAATGGAHGRPLDLSRFDATQRDGLAHSWAKQLERDGMGCIDATLARMTPASLELLNQRGGILKAATDLEYQRRSGVPALTA